MDWQRHYLLIGIIIEPVRGLFRCNYISCEKIVLRNIRLFFRSVYWREKYARSYWCATGKGAFIPGPVAAAEHSG